MPTHETAEHFMFKVKCSPDLIRQQTQLRHDHVTTKLGMYESLAVVQQDLETKTS